MKPAVKHRLSRQPRRSLRTILLVWFLLFSLVPVAFVTGYSLVKYEQAIDNELVQRLRANVREVNTMLTEYQNYLSQRMDRYQGDTSLISLVSAGNTAQARQLLRSGVRNTLVSNLSLFNRDGKLVASLTQDEAADQKDNTVIESQNLFIAENYREVLDKKGRLVVANPGAVGSMDLVEMGALKTSTGRKAGYVEEILNLGPDYFSGLKKRFNLEVMLLDSSGNIVTGSHPDFLLYPKNMFSKTIEEDADVIFDLPIRQEPFGFIISKVKWGDSNFYIVIGASKQKSKAIFKNISYAFFTVAGAIVVLVILLALVSSRVLLRPLSDLLEALEAMQLRDEVVEIPVTSDTELGVLTESFNEMSRRVRQARADLQGKIDETESAYSELKDAQARLVHSSKMVSLGQLVAGVAHELNNPIGFIYSNMTHLRDYSNRLLTIIERVEKNPNDLEKLKEENDFEYIVKDLPRLIQSCEDGARRVRDIVVGLRNFSRLEEAKIKKVNVADGIEQTLQLLTGELKGRVKVHTQFGEMPEVMCYASQLNQVFMNILSNAAQAIEGEGEIWITTSQIAPKNKLEGSGTAKISIRDNGKGMASDVIEKIFDPFFTTKNLGQGTGLGLSISYGIVRKHGGDITVKSEPGKGTEFVVTLPIDGPPTETTSGGPAII